MRSSRSYVNWSRMPQIRKTVCPYSNACESVFDIKGVTVKAQFGFENDILTHIKILYSPQQYETLQKTLWLINMANRQT